MTGPLEFVFSALWIAHPVLQSLLCLLMMRRHLVRQWPNFFAYTVVQVLLFGPEFFAHRFGSQDLFFYTSCASMIFGVVFGFRAIEEIYRDVFRPYHALRDLGVLLFRWVGLLMVLVAVVAAASSSQDDLGWLSNSILTLERSLRVMQCGLILFLLLFIQHLGITWRSRSFGIAAGFGFMALVETVMNLLQSRGGFYISINTLSMVNFVAYNVAIMIWFSYVLMPAVSAVRPGSSLRTSRWDEELVAIRTEPSGEKLIPHFESIVERALSRADQSGRAEEAPLSYYGMRNSQ